MRVLLLKEVESLGVRGELVQVADGFARNYLLPRKLAVPATAGVEAQASRMKAAEDKKREAKLAELKALADKLSGVSCTLARKAGPDEKLFGSVAAADIAAALAAQGLPVDRRQVQLAEHLKTLGVFTVPVKLAPEITAQVKVWIVREGEKK
jgi:large subunit ribosomal protein L9